MTTASEAGNTYFDAWRAKDPERLRPYLADDVHFSGSLAVVDGADEYVRSKIAVVRVIFDPRGMLG